MPFRVVRADGVGRDAGPEGDGGPQGVQVLDTRRNQQRGPRESSGWKVGLRSRKRKDCSQGAGTHRWVRAKDWWSEQPGSYGIIGSFPGPRRWPHPLGAGSGEKGKRGCGPRQKQL